MTGHCQCHFMANRWGKSGSSDRFYFLGLQITANGDCSHEMKRHFTLRRKAMTKLDSVLKITFVSKWCHFAEKGPYSQSYGFSSSHVQMWELDHKEGWGLKNWCFQTVVLEKTLEGPLDCKEIKPANSLEKTLMLGKTEGKRTRMRLLESPI